VKCCFYVLQISLHVVTFYDILLRYVFLLLSLGVLVPFVMHSINFGTLQFLKFYVL
jgi:hypothetical protein